MELRENNDYLKILIISILIAFSFYAYMNIPEMYLSGYLRFLLLFLAISMFAAILAYAYYLIPDVDYKLIAYKIFDRVYNNSIPIFIIGLFFLGILLAYYSILPRVTKETLLFIILIVVMLIGSYLLKKYDGNLKRKMKVKNKKGMAQIIFLFIIMLAFFIALILLKNLGYS